MWGGGPHHLQVVEPGAVVSISLPAHVSYGSPHLEDVQSAYREREGECLARSVWCITSFCIFFAASLSSLHPLVDN